MKRCPHCNAGLEETMKFCPKCGTAILSDRYSSAELAGNSPRKAPVVILAVLLVAIVAAAVFFIFGNAGSSGKKHVAEISVLPEVTTPPAAFSDDPAAITAASQSVVMLHCYNKQGDLNNTGSGFACFDDNIIVTNYHVIADNVYRIEASTENGRVFDIEHILATDPDRDIAILSTAAPHNLTLLQEADERIQKGEKVVAIGSPLGLLNSVSTGVFSGYLDDNGMDVLQFTASISHGSSGGALFNNSGEVLGITSASFEAGQNLNLAIPICAVAKVYESSDVSDRLTVAQFYDTFSRTGTVDHVIRHAKEFNFQDITVDGYVSYTFGYTDDGEAVQCLGLVSSRDQVLGATFTDDSWDEDADAETSYQENEGIAILVILVDKMDMRQYLETYKPGAFVSCPGYFVAADSETSIPNMIFLGE